MDSYGELLKNARESKGLEIERIARELTIDSRYLIGLEQEDTSVFPGDAYFIGFLKNYSNYLELDTEFLLKLYHNKKLQEEPVPTELLKKLQPHSKLPWILIPSGVVVALAVFFTIFFIQKNKTVEVDNVVVSSTVKNKQYELTSEKFSKRLYKGDQLLVPTDNGQIVLTVHDTISSFGIDTPGGKFYTDLAEENEIDIDGDSVSDMIVYVSDISSTDANRGAEVSILLRHGIVDTGYSVVLEDIPFASEIKSNHPQKVILEDNRAYPFTINANFRGSCLFRDKVDNAASVETYFTRGELFTATPHNGIRLWISNSNTVKFTIIADSRTFDLEIGAAGKILVEDIKWIKDTDGKYKLVVIELD